jgi:hypothetical protein
MRDRPSWVTRPPVRLLPSRSITRTAVGFAAALAAPCHSHSRIPPFSLSLRVITASASASAIPSPNSVEGREWSKTGVSSDGCCWRIRPGHLHPRVLPLQGAILPKFRPIDFRRNLAYSNRSIKGLVRDPRKNSPGSPEHCPAIRPRSKT